MKKVLILGIGGQDSSYLAEHLIRNGDEVFGVHRRTSTGNLLRLNFIDPRVRSGIALRQGDLTDTESIIRIVREVDPDEIYNLADQDDVRWSFENAGYNYDVTGSAVGRLLQALLDEGKRRPFFQAISATVFGSTTEGNVSTPFDPRSPYAVAKLFALSLCRYYRKTHFYPVATAILFNHDSPRRGEGYLLQKICRQIVDFAEDPTVIEPAKFYNVDTLIDVGPAEQYVKSFSHILRQHVKGDGEGDVIVGNGNRASIETLIMFALNSYRELKGESINVEDVFEFSNSDLISPDPLWSGGTLETETGVSPTFAHGPLVEDILSELLFGITL